MHDKNLILEGKLSHITSVVDKILNLVENRLGQWSPPTETPPTFVDIIPDFKTLKTAFDGTDFRHFIYEFLTNRTEESWKSLSGSDRFELRSKYNKQVIAVNTFRLFMDTISPRPTNPMLIQPWKGVVSQKVNEGIKKLRIFIESHPEIKASKYDSTITQSLMSKKKNVMLINRLMGLSDKRQSEVVVLPNVETEMTSLEAGTDSGVGCLEKESDVYKAIASWSRKRMVTHLNNLGLKSSCKKSILTERIMYACNEESTNRFVMEWTIEQQTKKKKKPRKRKRQSTSVVALDPTVVDQAIV